MFGKKSCLCYDKWCADFIRGGQPITTGVYRDRRNHKILEQRTLSSIMSFYRWGDRSSGSLLDLPNDAQFISSRVRATTILRPGLMTQEPLSTIIHQIHPFKTELQESTRHQLGTARANGMEDSYQGRCRRGTRWNCSGGFPKHRVLAETFF